MYYSGMSPPKKPPVSLRLSDELVAEVAAFAGKRKITRNAAYALLIRDGLRANGPSLPSPERQAEIKACAQARQARQATAIERGKPLSVSVPLASNAPAPFGTRLKKR